MQNPQALPAQAMQQFMQIKQNMQQMQQMPPPQPLQIKLKLDNPRFTKFI
jgi:hypothetical protein